LKPCLDIKGALKRNETNLNIQSQLTDACNATQGPLCKAALGSRPSAREVSGPHGSCLLRCDAVLSDTNLTTFRTNSLLNFQHSGNLAKTYVNFYQTARQFVPICLMLSSNLRLCLQNRKEAFLLAGRG